MKRYGRCACHLKVQILAVPVHPSQSLVLKLCLTIRAVENVSEHAAIVMKKATLKLRKARFPVQNF